MQNIFISLLNTSITASYLVIAVMLLRPLLKKAPKYIRCILWGLVGLRLILPFSFESVLSLIPSAEPIPPEIVTSPAPVIHSGITFVNSAVNPVISQSFAPAPEASVNPMQVVMAVAWNVWLLGVIAMVLYSIISFVLLKRKLREAVQDGGNVWLCDRVSSPFLLGLFRPKIYLPSALAEGDRQYVLAHENAHIRRKDHWWKPLGFLLLTVYWFNPLMWVAYIFLCRDIEFACDEKVIKELGTDCKCAYSEALINCSVPRRMISACPVAFGEDGVKGRIKSVLNYKKPAFWIILIALILCIVVAVCFLTNPPEDEQSDKIPANEYRFRATVVEIYEDSLLVEPLEKEEYFSGAKQVVLRLNGRSKDDYRLGCIVEIIYDSQIQESMPPVIPNASSIFNLDMVSSHLPDPHYSFTATVTEVLDDCIIVKYQHFPLHNFEFSYYQVNTDPTGYTVGDKVNIAYDGTVTETEPYDILGEIYSIKIVTNEESDTPENNSITGKITEIHDDYIVVSLQSHPPMEIRYFHYKISVSTDGFLLGDIVKINHNGNISEDGPYYTFDTVYSIDIVTESIQSAMGFHDYTNAIACDIDNDSIVENCYIGYTRYTDKTFQNDALSITFLVQENGITEYCYIFEGFGYDCGFLGANDNKARFVTMDKSGYILSIDQYFVTSLGRLAFISETNSPFMFTYPESHLEELSQSYPHFFGLDTFKGLEVYVWKNGDWRCGVRSGTNRLATQEELWAFRGGATLDEMALILSTYGITQDDVFILYSYDPAFSGEYPNKPSEGNQAYIEDTLFAYLPQRVATEPYIVPEFQVQKQYPLIVYTYKLAENSWRFRFYENTTIFDSMQDASMKLDGLTMQDAWAKMEQYDYPPEEIPVIPINSHLSSYYYEINEQTAAEARLLLGLLRLSNSDEQDLPIKEDQTPTEPDPSVENIQPDSYRLMVAGKDITQNANFTVYKDSQYVALPLIAVVRQFGAKIDWTGATTATLTINGKRYILDIANASLIKEGSDFDYILPAPGSTLHTEVTGNELLIDNLNFRYVLQFIGINVKIDIDHQAKLINIATSS